ncbi:biliverdin-producing heme oxygenase [Silvibacterium acidisoli]|uniref:biliverdin-producing heme oxygenase n=1 Tax=Acidobacteriaceae bacterium ZG23-2 TaxID=2883246 RepID=UPI00406CFCA5
MSTKGIATALRSGTAEAHEALEGELRLASSALSLAEYVHTLQTFEGFVSRWEDEAEQACPPHLKPTFEQRRRARLLQGDLRHFDASKAEEQPRIPPITNTAAFLGSMYVMEGSTLGGQMIARHVESHLHLSNGDGYSYFLGHGANTGRMWKEFIEILNRESQDLPEAEIVSSARRTFESFRAFIQSRQG